MYVDITKLETRKNPETIKPINTIPSTTFGQPSRLTLRNNKPNAIATNT